MSSNAATVDLVYDYPIPGMGSQIQFQPVGFHTASFIYEVSYYSHITPLAIITTVPRFMNALANTDSVHKPNFVITTTSHKFTTALKITTTVHRSIIALAMSVLVQGSWASFKYPFRFVQVNLINFDYTDHRSLNFYVR